MISAPDKQDSHPKPDEYLSGLITYYMIPAPDQDVHAERGSSVRASKLQLALSECLTSTLCMISATDEQDSQPKPYEYQSRINALTKMSMQRGAEAAAPISCNLPGLNAGSILSV